MSKPRVFISFDLQNDDDLRDLILEQGSGPDFPLAIVDWSNTNGVGDVARQELQQRFTAVDLIVVLCGEMTHQADNVSFELAVGEEADKPNVLLWGRKGRLVCAPKAAGPKDQIHEWSWEVLERIVRDGQKSYGL